MRYNIREPGLDQQQTIPPLTLKQEKDRETPPSIAPFVGDMADPQYQKLKPKPFHKVERPSLSDGSTKETGLLHQLQILSSYCMSPCQT